MRRKRISSLLSSLDTSQSKELSNVDRLVVLLCPSPLHSTWKQKCSHLALTICLHIYNDEVNHTVYSTFHQMKLYIYQGLDDGGS